MSNGSAGSAIEKRNFLRTLVHISRDFFFVLRKNNFFKFQFSNPHVFQLLISLKSTFFEFILQISLVVLNYLSECPKLQASFCDYHYFSKFPFLYFPLLDANFFKFPFLSFSLIFKFPQKTKNIFLNFQCQRGAPARRLRIESPSRALRPRRLIYIYIYVWASAKVVLDSSC